MPNDPQEYARRFYAALRDLDARGVDEILIELPPDEPQWRAVRDRIIRASHDNMENHGDTKDSELTNRDEGRGL